MESENITILLDGTPFSCRLDPVRSPQTVEALLGALLLSARPVQWGGELYIDVPFHRDPERATTDLHPGDIAYWPPGDVLCVFFGATPASTGDRPVPASPVTVVGSLEGYGRIARLCPVAVMDVRGGT